MPRGGKRLNAGRTKNKAEQLPAADKKIATLVFASLEDKDWEKKHELPDKDGKGGCLCEICRWRALIVESLDARLEFDVLKYLTDRRDGKAVQTVNHLHDKPIEMDVTVMSLADAIQKARKRAGTK